MNKSAIAPATEIVVSLMSQYADTQGNRQLQDDPRTYIYKTTHISIPQEVDVAVVQNSDKTVNLALPYYDVVNQNPPATIGEEDLASVAGGCGMGFYSQLLLSDACCGSPVMGFGLNAWPFMSAIIAGSIGAVSPLGLHGENMGITELPE